MDVVMISLLSISVLTCMKKQNVVFFLHSLILSLSLSLYHLFSFQHILTLRYKCPLHMWTYLHRTTGTKTQNNVSLPLFLTHRRMHYTLAFLFALQSALCAFQHAFWHAALQYKGAIVQALHLSSLATPASAAVFPHAAHASLPLALL